MEPDGHPYRRRYTDTVPTTVPGTTINRNSIMAVSTGGRRSHV
jgi:hypothetical protein